MDRYRSKKSRAVSGMGLPGNRTASATAISKYKKVETSPSMPKVKRDRTQSDILTN